MSSNTITRVLVAGAFAALASAAVPGRTLALTLPFGAPAKAAAAPSADGGQPSAPAASQGKAPSPPPKPVKATPEQRAEAERLDPLGRAAFWAREVDIDPNDNDSRLKLAKALRALGRFEEACSFT